MNIIEKYFPNLTDKQKRQFAQLDALYRDWNAKINVISRTSITCSTLWRLPRLSPSALVPKFLTSVVEAVSQAFPLPFSSLNASLS
mgnify:CR=1 FL=1